VEFTDLIHSLRSKNIKKMPSLLLVLISTHLSYRQVANNEGVLQPMRSISSQDLIDSVKKMFDLKNNKCETQSP